MQPTQHDPLRQWYENAGKEHGHNQVFAVEGQKEHARNQQQSESKRREECFAAAPKPNKFFIDHRPLNWRGRVSADELPGPIRGLQ